MNTRNYVNVNVIKVILLIAIVSIILIPYKANAAYYKDGSGIDTSSNAVVTTKSDGTAIITDASDVTGSFNATYVYVDGFRYEVIGIGDYAFRDNESVVSVIIPSSVKDIGKGVFWGCTNLVKAQFYTAQSTIKENMFNGCTNLATVNFSSAKVIEENAFRDCDALTKVVLKNVTVAKNAFRDCDGITDVTTSQNVTIGANAFRDCDELTKVKTGKDCVLGPNCFYKCKKLETVELGKNTVVKNKVFYKCNKLDDITINTSKSSYTVGSQAFYNIAKKPVFKIKGVGGSKKKKVIKALKKRTNKSGAKYK